MTEPKTECIRERLFLSNFLFNSDGSFVISFLPSFSPFGIEGGIPFASPPSFQWSRNAARAGPAMSE